VSVSLVTAWQAARKALEAAGIEEPTFDARLLVEAGAGVVRHDILTDPRRELSDPQVAAINALVARRTGREPMSHILGKKGFRTIELAITRDVLTPRPDTEILVEAALRAMPNDRPVRVLDFGVGSGAILAALLTERPLATGVGVDASESALLVAQSNFEALDIQSRVRLILGDWGTELDERFDIIVSNPPYIPTSDIDTLEPEVARYEPRIALDGGPDGLDAYRALLPHVSRLLAPDGLAAFEIGAGQEGQVQALIEAAGLQPLTLRKDLAGHFRVWTARLEKPLGKDQRSD
jgi:release factor glutamine methyltransferase